MNVIKVIFYENIIKPSRKTTATVKKQHKNKCYNLKAHDACTSKKNGPSCPAEKVEGIIL